MTLINVISGYIYLRGFPLKDKIQTYGIAAIFLVLLYNSPSGLVFYWTLNQIFSVAKNVLMKLIKDQKMRNIIFALGGGAFVFILALRGMLKTRNRIIISAVIFICCCLPLIVSKIKEKIRYRNKSVKSIKPMYFVLGAVFLTIFGGLLIPLAVINSSPIEFITNYSSPVVLICNNVCIYAGFFLLWLGIYYYLSENSIRNIFAYIVWIISGVVLTNYLFFPGKYGIMSTQFIFDNPIEITKRSALVNLLVICVIALLLFFIMTKWKRIIPLCLSVLIIGSIGMSTVYAVNIVSQTDVKEERMAENSQTVDNSVLTLSKTGNNVIVLMLDRAISGYVPYMLNERPILKEQFAGFTYYPNTVSYAHNTIFATPFVFGGYEYIPTEMNKRNNESLVKKHNEAMKVLPVLFSNNEYNVTVCDIPYANYQDPGDMSIYDEYRNINAYHLRGKYTNELNAFSPKKQTRNLFYYTIFRFSPIIFREKIYNEGKYLTTNTFSVSESFLDCYSTLCQLVNITNITESAEQCFLMIDNETPHYPAVLQTPEYEPREQVTSDPLANQERFTLNGKTIKMDNSLISHYHANMVTFLKIGEWLDFLRKQGVYDNTRIIIVSDHGYDLGQFDELLVTSDFDVQRYNPLLMVKDFQSSDFSVSYEFMTNADTAYMAVNGIIENAVNPFTGKSINDDLKNEDPLIMTSSDWKKTLISKDKTIFDNSDGNWWRLINQNIFDKNNWEKVQ